jgi:Cd2+/Zn2+-exporting ATPase
MKKYSLNNISCANCAAKIEQNLNADQSVRSASVNFAAKTLLIDADDIARVKKIIASIEPDAALSAEPAPDDFSFRRELIPAGASLLLFAAGLFLPDLLSEAYRDFARFCLFFASWVTAGHRVLFSAARNLVHGRVFDENFLMSISTIGAFAVGALSEAAAVMIFFRIGEFFQDLSVARTRRSIKALLAIRPDYANLIEPAGIRTVAPETVTAGEKVLVKPGEKVPLDGVITEGSSSLDTSALTGESLPRDAVTGSAVLSGMINLHGTITVLVSKPYAESSAAKILELVENASARKAKSEKFITSFARVYTPIVVAGAILIAVIPPLLSMGTFAEWTYRALILLVISCPCALVVSVPLGYFGGIGGASRKGILFKGSNVLDAAAKIKTAVFDKTGTLTEGRFRVTEIVRENGFSEDEILRFAADAESHSNHPIARSILEAVSPTAAHDEIEDYTILPGMGASATVLGREILVGNDRMLHEKGIDHRICCKDGTVVHVVVDGVHAGYIVVSDTEKPDARTTVDDLKTQGIRVIMLTGDTMDAAAASAGRLGIEDFRAELLPHEKVAELEKIMTDSEGTVAFIGDGINDAPVIARADVGAAMGSLGSDAAIETADLVLMTDSPSKLVEAVRIGKKVRLIVLENIVFALAVKAIVACMGVAGTATMWEAVFADIGVALIAVFNSMRALR